MLVPCTVLIKRRPRRMGKYGVTVARSDELRVTMELAADADLSCLLLDLGYTQAEVEHILKELGPKKTSIQHPRVIDEFALHDNGL